MTIAIANSRREVVTLLQVSTRAALAAVSEYLFVCVHLCVCVCVCVSWAIRLRSQSVESNLMGAALRDRLLASLLPGPRPLRRDGRGGVQAGGARGLSAAAERACASHVCRV